MAILDDQRQERALRAMHDYLSATPLPSGKTYPEEAAERDDVRRALIKDELKPRIEDFLAGKMPLVEFKSQIDGLNKRHLNWGFRGIKGQMFFNMVVRTARDQTELLDRLKAALRLPETEARAREQLTAFSDYVTQIGEEHCANGGAKAQRPKLGSVGFFVSYFWQIQNWQEWPVFYTNSLQVLDNLSLWQRTGEIGEDYLLFKHIHEELAQLFAAKSGEAFDLYRVEHVLWQKGGNPYLSVKTGANNPVEEKKPIERRVKPILAAEDGIPGSYVPPIVAALPLIGRNDPLMVEAAKTSSISLERAFEIAINAAFTILGYETKLLGQGRGRVPDGVAVDTEDSYAIIWDAKLRTDGYNMGTDDRAIREYISSQYRDLKKRYSTRNIYYAIVSSRFHNDCNEIIQALKMQTEIREVILIEADALVAMVDLKLREPNEVVLGPDGIQRLFSSSGILTAQNVHGVLDERGNIGPGRS